MKNGHVPLGSRGFKISSPEVYGQLKGESERLRAIQSIELFTRFIIDTEHSAPLSGYSILGPWEKGKEQVRTIPGWRPGR